MIALCLFNCLLFDMTPVYGRLAVYNVTKNVISYNDYNTQIR
jgi:hypothetical protein